MPDALTSSPPEVPKTTVRDVNIELQFAGPWRRFFARLVDLWAIGIPTGYIVALVSSSLSMEIAFWLQEPGSQFAFGLLLLPLILLIEAVIFGLFGSTLGKALLGIKVVTAAAYPASFSEYAERQSGVYWYGLGAGIPIVTLFTMARQHERLKQGKQAGYDEGRFNAKAQKLTPFRKILVPVVIAGLVSVNLAIRATSAEADRAYYAGFDWTNVVTGRTVAIPTGWIHESQDNVDGAPIDVFSSPRVDTIVVFAKEEIDPALSIDEYAELWAGATEETMALSLPGQPTTVRGLAGLQITGSVSGDQTQRIDALLVRNESQMWRVVLLRTSGRDPASEEAKELRNVLFTSIE